MGLTLAMGLPARAEQVVLRSYGQADGLANLTVTALAQDGDGYLWAGTQNGLYRFDGERFHRVDTQTRLVDIVALVSDPRGGLWVGTGNGLYRWKPEGVERLSPPAGQPLFLTGTADLAVDANGTILFISESRLYELRPRADGSSREAAEALDQGEGPGPSLTGIAVDRGGTVWLACGTGLCRRNGRQLERMAFSNRDAPDQGWTGIRAARDGTLWLRNARSLARYFPATGALVDQHLPSPVATISSLSPPIAEDAAGRILTGGVDSLGRWAPERSPSAWQFFDRQHGMPPGGRFISVFVDREGEVWLSRAGSGLSRWSGYGRWEHWTRADGLPHDVVWTVARDNDGVLHAATSSGVAKFDAQARRFDANPETLGLHITTLLGDTNGRVWATTTEGALLRREPASRHYLKAAPDAGQIFRLLQRPDGKLWFAGQDGVGWWPDASSQRLPLRGRVLATRDVQAADLCAGPGGDLWAATDSGLLRISADGQVTPAGGSELRGYVASIACARDGSLYASNDHGRLFLVRPDATPPRSEDITPPLLAERTFIALLEDRRGWLWANTDAGVAVWNGRQWRLLDQSQGLIWNDTSGPGLFEDGDGTVWISTSQGLSHLLTPPDIFAPTLPALRISGILHGGQPLSQAGPLRLKWSRAAALEVAVESPSYRDRPIQAFEHRLVGFDDRWQPTGGSVIRYAGLPAGSYTLQARLVDQQLGSSSPAVELRLEIAPPWWETWTFRLLSGALLAALAYAVHLWRLRSARERERELAGLVAERTRELEASREELRERATKDGLTGAWNRRTVLEMLEHDVERSARDEQPLTVVLADIDHFKRINDELGHPAGDEVLRQFVARLRAVVRPYDAIGRYGGEEFVVLLRGLNIDTPDDRVRVEAIRAAIAEGPMMLGHGMQREVTCSFGAACARAGSSATPEDLIREADEALYRAKRAGRNRVEYASVAK